MTRIGAAPAAGKANHNHYRRFIRDPQSLIARLYRPWLKDLAVRLLNLQKKREGFLVDDNGRWLFDGRKNEKAP